jgi:hypothetical protein
MRLRRWALKGFVVDAPQFNDKLVPMYGYKIRFKVVKL